MRRGTSRSTRGGGRRKRGYVDRSRAMLSKAYSVPQTLARYNESQISRASERECQIVRKLDHGYSEIHAQSDYFELYGSQGRRSSMQRGMRWLRRAGWW